MQRHKLSVVQLWMATNVVYDLPSEPAPQSSGPSKASSLSPLPSLPLENLTPDQAISGIPFPRGSGLVTRCATQLIMKSGPKGSAWSARASIPQQRSTGWRRKSGGGGDGVEKTASTPEELTQVGGVLRRQGTLVPRRRLPLSQAFRLTAGTLATHWGARRH